MRTSIADVQRTPIENLATNPKFRRVNSGSSVVRRNFVLDPIGRTNAYWSPSVVGGVSNYGIPMDDPKMLELGIVSYNRVVWVNAPTASPAVLGTSSIADRRFPIIGGTVYTMSAYTYRSFELSTGIRVDVVWYDENGNANNTTTGPYGPQGEVGKWHRVSRTIEAPENATHARFYISFSGPQSNGAGGEIRVAGLLAEACVGVRPFIYGDMIDDSGVVYEWEGEPAASSSVAKAAVVEVRRNYFENPGLEVDAAGWLTSGSGSSIQRVTDVFHRGNASLKVTASLSDTGCRYTPFTLTVGLTHTFSAWVLAPVGVSLKLHIDEYGEAGYLGQAAKSFVGTGSWQFVSVSKKNAVGASYRVGVRTMAAGSVEFYVDDACMMVAGVDAFDGDRSPDSGLIPGWVGDRHNSQSVLVGTRVAPYGSSSTRVHIRGVDDHGDRIFPMSSSTDTFVNFGTTDSGQVIPGLKPGALYTILARLTMTQAQLTNASRNRRIYAYTRSASETSYVVTSSGQPPNAPGVSEHRVFWRIPGDVTEAFIRFYNGDPADGYDLMWDEILLVEGRYDGPYLDGDSPGAAWRDAPHASPSVGYPGT